MNCFTRFSRIMVLAGIAFASAPAFADVTLFANRTDFTAMGAIAENYGFEDINTLASADGLVFTADPWTAHGVTYTTGNNVIIGATAGYGAPSNVFSLNAFSPLRGDIGSAYNMFGFDIGTFFGTSGADIVLGTNLGSYSFLNQLVPAMSGMSFLGFGAGPGEFFTSFSITSVVAGTVPGIDNVMLGVITTPVPEPASCVLLLAGLVLVGTRERRRTRT
jgi:hypothetical protein